MTNATLISLEQKSIGSNKRFKIKENRLWIFESAWNKSVEYDVKFEKIGFDIQRKKAKALLWLIPVYFLLTALNIYILIDEINKGTRLQDLWLFVFGILGFGTGLFYSFFQKSESVMLTGGEVTIKINALIPSEGEVESFVSNLHSAIRDYYKSTYARIDLDLSRDASIQNFQWLKNIEAIDEQQYKDLIRELDFRNLI